MKLSRLRHAVASSAVAFRAAVTPRAAVATFAAAVVVGCATQPAAGPPSPVVRPAGGGPAADPAAGFRAATRPAYGGPPAPAATLVPGVPNFGVASTDVWRGGRPTAEGLRNLAALGVRTVIDLQEDDRSALVPPGVRYVPLRVSGWLCDRVDTAAVLRAIEENPKPVFVHCLGGRDRTGLAVGAYQLSRGVNVEAVLAELDRFGVHFWWRGPVAAKLRQLGAAGKATAGQVRPAVPAPS